MRRDAVVSRQRQQLRSAGRDSSSGIRRRRTASTCGYFHLKLRRRRMRSASACAATPSSRRASLLQFMLEHASCDNQWRGHHPLAGSQLRLLWRQRVRIALRPLRRLNLHRAAPAPAASRPAATPPLAFGSADNTHLRLLPAPAPAAAADAFGLRLRRLRLRSTCGDSYSRIRRRWTAPTLEPAATSCSGSSGSGGCVRPAATVATAALGLQGLALPPSVSSAIIGHRALWLAVWLALGRRRLLPPRGPASSSA